MTKIAQLTKRQSVDREPTTASNLHPTDPNGVGLGAKMNIHQHTAKNPTLHERLFIMLLLATIPAVFGCGVLPAGQGSTRNLTVTGFTSPVAMAYSTATSVQAIVPGIAISETGSTGFVQRLIMQAVYDVPESQARSAFLSDAVISTTLNQLINSYLRTIDVPKRSSNVIDPDNPIYSMQEHVFKAYSFLHVLRKKHRQSLD
ncbi:hypothetical protein KIN20_018273 [Parelaphostrongylus tenuis]|uniref:Uncharacterized protein n=1 Tax=Parelaphostrongylus tenuis TaxID=148309 RepID=A0AAD5QS01_PARTN|nr:hypothetical protein KIN20_018273 [Parelaphostrongylus tenuis]